MLALHPMDVRFGSAAWGHVTSVAIERSGARLVAEHADGPHVVFADVPQQQVLVRVVQEAASDSGPDVVPGMLGTLRFRTARGGGDARGAGVAIRAMVRGVAYGPPGPRGCLRTTTLLGVSEDGATDPVEVY